MTLLGFLGMASGAFEPSGMMAALSAVMGAAYFATGALHEGPWPRLVAGGWWAGAVALLLWPGTHAPLVMAGLMVAFQVVPGIVVYRSGRALSAAGRRGRPA